ncbi:MAG: hypothetical protein ACQEVA_11320, partial [Myxococcota bacterium]
MNLVTAVLIYGVLLPLVAGGLTLVLGWKPWRRDRESARPVWVAGLALGAAYLTGHVGVAHTPDSLIPTNALHWMIPLSLAAVLVSLVEPPTWQKPAVRWILRAVLLAVGARLVIGFMFDGWSTMQGVAAIACVTALGLALIFTLERIGERNPGATLPIAMMLTGSITAGLLADGGTAKVAQLIGAMVTVTGVAMVVSWWKSDFNFARGGATVFGIVLVLLATHGYFGMSNAPALSEFPNNPHFMALIATLLAPHLLWIGELDAIAKLGGWKATTARLLIVAMALGGAASLSRLIAPPVEESNDNV